MVSSAVYPEASGTDIWPLRPGDATQLACWPQGPVSPRHRPAGQGMPSCHSHPVPMSWRHHPPPGSAVPQELHSRPGVCKKSGQSLRARRGGPGRVGPLGESAAALSSAAKHTHGPHRAFDAFAFPSSGLQLPALSQTSFPGCASGLSLPRPRSLLSRSSGIAGAASGVEGARGSGQTHLPLLLPAPLPTISVTLGQSLNLFEPQLPFQQCGADSHCHAKLLRVVKWSS